MPETTEPIVLITELEDLDAHEDRIFGELLRRGAQLEEYERRRRMVTVAELHALKEGLQIEEDGDYGPRTRQTARRVLRGLGVAPADYEHGITPALRGLIRTPTRRSAAQLERARQNRPWLKALRKRYAVSGAAAARYPLGRRGKLIGRPHQGTHSLGNRQSDNAVDLGVAVGTTMLALDDGEVVKVSRHAQDGSRFAGDAITIRGDRGNSYFYKHGVASVRVGQRVKRGQVIGTTGSASGSPHLHLGFMKGDPLRIIGQSR